MAGGIAGQVNIKAIVIDLADYVRQEPGNSDQCMIIGIGAISRGIRLAYFFDQAVTLYCQ